MLFIDEVLQVGRSLQAYCIIKQVAQIFLCFNRWHSRGLEKFVLLVFLPSIEFGHR